ncbi:10075_t:CDS:2, partial [Scutellospora calospora]
EELLKNPIKHLNDVYVKINADIVKDSDIDNQAHTYFKKIETDTYAHLNINFDIYSNESQISNKRISFALKILKKKNIAIESNSAIITDLGKYKLDIVIIQKNN